MKNRIIVTSSLLAALLGAAVPASAVGLGANATVKVNAAPAVVGVNADVSARLATAMTRSDAAIDARVNALAELSARVLSIKNISEEAKAAIAADVKTNTDGLAALKAKIHADTDAETLKTDEKSILGSFRIYALVIPRGFLLAAGGHADAVADMMTTMSAKLKVRIDAAAAAGADVAALNAALADISAKIATSRTEITAAESGVVALKPDGGNTSQAQANHAALVAAHAHVKASTEALKAARKDVDTIVKGLKSINANASASGSTEVH